MLYLNRFEANFDVVSLNYIKQLGLKDDLPLTLHQTMEVLHPNEYAILSVRVGVWEGLSSRISN